MEQSCCPLLDAALALILEAEPRSACGLGRGGSRGCCEPRSGQGGARGSWPTSALRQPCL